MDNSYQQAMIQALMGGQSLAPGMGGQNPTTPYGQGFMTGNMMSPTNNTLSNQAAMGTSGQQPGMNSSNTLTAGPSTMLAQPMQSY